MTTLRWPILCFPQIKSHHLVLINSDYNNRRQSSFLCSCTKQASILHGATLNFSFAKKQLFLHMNTVQVIADDDVKINHDNSKKNSRGSRI